ncbi:tRNA intron endonuclease, partial [Oesophagostomum dentatum]
LCICSRCSSFITAFLIVQRAALVTAATIQTTDDIESKSVIPLQNYITVDYVNDSFIVLDENEAKKLKDDWRMITQNNGERSPHFLSPEQVAVLALYGNVLFDSSETRESFTAEASTTSTSNAEVGDSSSTNESTRKLVEFKKIDTSKGQHRWLDDFDVPLPSTRDHRAREVIFHDLWRKGYYLTSGEQFGCAYLVYEGLPGKVHAKYLLEYIQEDNDVSMMDMVSLVRVATQVKKDLLLAIIASDSHQPHYLKFEWFKPYSKEFE